MSPTHPRRDGVSDEAVRAEAVRTLYLQMRNSAWSALVVSLYMAGTAARFTAWPAIIGWAAVMLATQMAREALIHGWRRRARGDGETGAWARAYTLYMVATGLVWGSTIILFAHPDKPITVALTLCCLYAIAAGSTPANAYNPPGLHALVGFMFVPVVARLAATARAEYVLLAAASGLYAVAMSGMCRVQARTLDEGFRIRFENTALLEAVRVEKDAAEAARWKAEAASLAKSQFLAAASHDLRQPLYALNLFSASLAELELGAEARAVVGRIGDSLAAMEQLFEGLLDLSRLDAGAVRPRLGAVSVDALFDRLSQYFRPAATERGLELRLRSDGEWVWSDATLLEQVLGNLLGNALRYTRRGGVLVSARRRGGAICLDVWDTGIGIAATDLHRIFEEFVQVGNTARERRLGLGLGLSIAQRSSALLHAGITVTSRPGRGSRFGVSQPETAPPGLDRTPPAAMRDAMAPARPGQGGRLLIVDDDPAVRSALSGLLRGWGEAFDVAADAEAALALVRGGGRYGLVLTDFRLPGALDGLALIAAITRLHAPPTPPAALITADLDPALVQTAARMGVPVLTKPLRPGQIRALLGLPTFPTHPGPA